MRPSRKAVVAGLPKSWQTAPSMTASRCGRGRSSTRVRAWSTTCSVCTQTSPSGCHSGSWTQPTSACSSGHRRSTTPRSRARARPVRRPRAPSSFSNSPQMRSAGRSSSAIDRQIARVSSFDGQVEPGCELDGAQHAQAVVAEGARDRRRAAAGVRGRRGRRTGRRYSPVSGSNEIALIVKSRRRAASSTLIAGSPADDEAAMTAPGLRLAARQRHVDVAALVDLEALADGFDAAERFEQRCAARCGIDAEHLDVDVLRLVPEQVVAHPAADNECAAAGALHGAGNLYARVHTRVAHRGPHRGRFAQVLLRIGSRPHRLRQPVAEPGRDGVEHGEPLRDAMRVDFGHRAPNRRAQSRPQHARATAAVRAHASRTRSS